MISPEICMFQRPTNIPLTQNLSTLVPFGTLSSKNTIWKVKPTERIIWLPCTLNNLINLQGQLHSLKKKPLDGCACNLPYTSCNYRVCFGARWDRVGCNWVFGIKQVKLAPSGSPVGYCHLWSYYCLGLQLLVYYNLSYPLSHGKTRKYERQRMCLQEGC